MRKILIPDGNKNRDHRVFSELDLLIEFYDSLSTLVIPFVTSGTNATICNIDSYIFSSIQGTVSSIHHVLGCGRINDAYSLLRKYYDTVVINIYSTLYLQEKFGLDNFVVQEINDWLKGKKKLPGFGKMMEFIQNTKSVKPITDFVLADDRYKQLRKRCNDHRHHNFFHYLVLNDSTSPLSHRVEYYDRFSADLCDIFVLPFSYIFYANNAYMMSSDYRDYLECGMTPEPDSQYWVAPFVQEAFDLFVKKHRPEIAEALKNHTRMQLN